MLTLEARLTTASGQDEATPDQDFQLRDRLDHEPSLIHMLSTGTVDRYLERLREVHGDREGKTDS